MKVKVKTKFRDKYTGARYKRGDVLEITEERYEEIMSVGNLVQKIAQDADSNASVDEVNNSLDEAEETTTDDSAKPSDGFEEMSVRELREYADSVYKLTFKTGTKRAEIIETLRKMEKK